MHKAIEIPNVYDPFLEKKPWYLLRNKLKYVPLYKNYSISFRD